MPRAKLPSSGDRRAADGNGPDRVTFLLDGVAALAANRARHSSSKLQVVVSGVDDGIGVALRQVPNHQMNFGVWPGHEFASNLLKKGSRKRRVRICAPGGPPLRIAAA